MNRRSLHRASGLLSLRNQLKRLRYGLGQDSYPRLWLHGNEQTSTPVHIAFSADGRSIVDLFWKQALLAGGKDNSH